MKYQSYYDRHDKVKPFRPHTDKPTDPQPKKKGVWVMYAFVFSIIAITWFMVIQYRNGKAIHDSYAHTSKDTLGWISGAAKGDTTIEKVPNPVINQLIEKRP